ncbi:peroxisomal membrane protein 2-like isoform X1 [Mytilus edulis]|uniref:peroxisomal membrane protein 2-like isoform X1 n=1 Tax=Mytilus edulis TaxID=6550 RepID=UPI0039EFB41E
MSLSKDKSNENAFEKALKAYLGLLQSRPVLTKAITSSSVSAIGNIISQLIVPNQQNGGKIAWRSVAAYASFSSSVSAIGNIISQLIVPNQQNGGKIAWRSVATYASFSFVVSGPLIHYFYIWMDKLIPKKKESATFDGIKRVVFDRFIFAPPFILLFLYAVTMLEGSGHEAAIAKIKETFWPILKMNWQIWTVFQFINVNYVPLKYRVLFGNAVALVWSVIHVIVAVKRRQLAQ